MEYQSDSTRFNLPFQRKRCMQINICTIFICIQAKVRLKCRSCQVGARPTSRKTQPGRLFFISYHPLHFSRTCVYKKCKKLVVTYFKAFASSLFTTKTSQSASFECNSIILDRELGLCFGPVCAFFQNGDLCQPQNGFLIRGCSFGAKIVLYPDSLALTNVL